MKILTEVVTDLLILAGAAGISYGVWRVDPSAGLVVAGGLLLTGGLLRARAEAHRNAAPPRGRGDT